MRVAEQSTHRTFLHTPCVPAPARRDDTRREESQGTGNKRISGKWEGGSEMRDRGWLAHHALRMHIYLYTFRSVPFCVPEQPVVAAGDQGSWLIWVAINIQDFCCTGACLGSCANGAGTSVDIA